MNGPLSLRDISAIVLAAGMSRRFGAANKLLHSIDEIPVIQRLIQEVVEVGFKEVLVVVGYESDQIIASLEKFPVRFVEAYDYQEGMGNSISAGIRAAHVSARGLAVMPGDLPFLTTETIEHVCSEFVRNQGEKHIIPLYHDTPGHPVVLGGWIRRQLEAIRGDLGAKTLLAVHPEAERALRVQIKEDTIVRDFDIL